MPSSVDWREKGAVTAVKDQRNCGSCWAFGAVGAVESHYFLKTGNLTALSEQNVLDCYEKGGCGGGRPVGGSFSFIFLFFPFSWNIFDFSFQEYAFNYIIENNGIDTEASYPYEAVEGKCHYTVENRGAEISGYVNIPENDELKLMEAVATYGPIVACIDVTAEMMHYVGGIFHDDACSSTRLKHAVVVVGYGINDNGTEYYIVKNSWSSSWGEDGYMYTARNRDNHCGIATYATFPRV